MSASDSRSDLPPRARLAISPVVVDVLIRGLIPLLGIAVLMTGLLGVATHAVLPLVDVIRSRDWVPTLAMVETAAVRPAALGFEPASMELLEVRYRYTFGGQHYVGEAYGPHHGVDHGVAHLQTLRLLESTPAVTVWVNPEAPEQAVLSRDLRWPVMALAVPALVLTVIGALMVFAGMVAWNNWRSWRWSARG